jgi:hypothetical protein
MKKNIFLLMFALIGLISFLDAQILYKDEDFSTNEEKTIAKPEINGWAFRKGDTLFLKMNNNRIDTLIDVDTNFIYEDGSLAIIETEGHFDTLTNGCQYRFLDIFSKDFYLVSCMQYERLEIWINYYLINRLNGKRIFIEEPPLFSKNINRFIVYRGYGEAMEPIIKIVNVKNNSFKIEMNLLPKKWQPKDVKWISDTEIMIERIKADYSDSPLPSLKYKWNGSKWILVK